MRIFKLSLSLTLIASTMTMNAAALTETPQENEKETISIDVNNDGQADYEDIKDLAKAIITSDLTAEQIQLFDINGDGEVNVGDIIKAIEILTKGDSDKTPGISNDPYDGPACAKKRE